MGPQIIAFEKSGLYDCGLTKVRKRVFPPSATDYPDGSRSRTIQPAVTSGGGANAAYLMAFDTRIDGNAVTGTELVVYRIKKDSGRLRLTNTAVKTGPARIHPYAALQPDAPPGDPDSRWDAGKLELTNVFYDTARRRLYTAHAAEKDIGGDGWVDIGIRWYEVKVGSPLADSKVLRKGLFGTKDTDAGYPGVATDAAGNVIVGFSRASGVNSAEEYLSSWATVIEPGDTVPDQGNTILLAAGDTMVDAAAGWSERWGDYMAINRDPADGSQVWVFGHAADSGAGPGGFLQWVDLVGFP